MEKEYEFVNEARWLDMIKSAANWSHITYRDLSDLDKHYINRVFKFGYTAKFSGFDFKGSRGISPYPPLKFNKIQGYKPRVIANYEFDDKSFAVELVLGPKGLDLVRDRILTKFTESSWYRRYNSPGGVVRSYLTKCNLESIGLKLFDDEFYNSILLQDYELGKAREAVEAYVIKNTHASTKFLNVLKTHLGDSKDPHHKLRALTDFGKAVALIRGEITDEQIIRFVRVAVKHRYEFQLLTQDDLDRVVNLNTVEKVHK